MTRRKRWPPTDRNYGGNVRLLWFILGWLAAFGVFEVAVPILEATK